MKNKRRIVGLVAAMLLALVGTVSLVAYVRSAKDKAVAQEALVDVYVVDTFVPKGADPDTIRSSVEIEQVPARLMQTGAVTDLQQIGDPATYGLDAMFPAAFLALLAPQLRQPGARTVALVGALIAVVLLPVAPAGVPVLAAALALLAVLWRRSPTVRHP